MVTRFARLREPTKKLAAFRTVKGRQIALERERRNDIFVWIERYEARVEGVEIRNLQCPGQTYAADQSRSTAVNSQCANLAVGRQAFYLRCATIGALERLVNWYTNA